MLKDFIPPILLPFARKLASACKPQPPPDPREPALRAQFEKINATAGENEIVMRHGLTLKIHRSSRHAFEHFCYRSPTMVDEMDRFMELTRDKRSLLDIGALHGVFSLMFAASSPSKRAIAVDASPIAFASLLYNIHKNAFQNITPVECAVSSDSGILRMHYEWEHAVAADNRVAGQEFLSVPKRAGDDLCREFSFEPDVIKIDVEGHEVKIIRGLSRILRDLRPLVFLELHPLRIVEESDRIEDLTQAFANNGYSASSLDGRTVSPDEIHAFADDQRLVFAPC
jgi:FkbM family methyltransferase